eukprot:PITA_19463
MLFGHPSVNEAKTFKVLLDTFSAAFGTTINTNKSQIFFFNTSITTQRTISRIIGFPQAKLPSHYLGAPLIDSTLKHVSWHQLLEEMDNRLQSWIHRTLNMTSRLVLIKVVLQSMPLYLFSVLAALKWVLKRVRNLQCNFLWGSTGQNRKMGLGQVGKVLIPGTNHNRNDTNQENTVAYYWNPSNTQGFRQWKPVEQIVKQEAEAYSGEIHKELTNRKIKVNTGSDVLRWGYTPRGTYTTKEAYEIMSHSQDPIDPTWNSIWTAGIWPKVSTFIWSLYHGRILTWDNLIKQGFHGPSYCPNCQNNEETI